MSRFIKKFLVLLVYLFILIPLIYTFLLAFTGSDTMNIEGFSIKWFIAAFQSNAFMDAMANSLIVALCATIIAVILSLLSAYAIYKNRHLKRIKDLFILFDAPLIVPNIVLSFLFFQIFIVHIGTSNMLALILAHTIVLFPYAIRAIANSLLKFDENIDHAARTLGMNEIQVIVKVILPNISSVILAVSLISFINSFNNLSISLFLTGPGLNMLPLQIMGYMEQNYNPIVASLSVIIIFVTIMIIVFVEKKLKFSLIKN